MTLSCHIDHLIDCVHETEGGVEAATRYGTGCVNHGKKCEGNSGGLKDTVLALLCAVVNLANDALAEEECAPELEKEDLAKTVEVDAPGLLVIRAQEGWLSHTEVSINNTEEATDDLSYNNHTYQRRLVEELSLCSIDCKGHCRVEHTSGDFACHENAHE